MSEPESLAIAEGSVNGPERWSRLALAGAFPLLFLPALLLPPDRFAAATAPVVAVVFVLRRVIIPKWLRAQTRGR